jgi:glutamine amidotransferase
MIAILDYGAGNIRSVRWACSEIGAQSVVVSTPAHLQDAERIIFPGVGAAPSAMETLRKTGLVEALRHSYELGIPMLGICLGTQIILDSSEEGKTPCLGLISGATIRFKLQDKLLKIPHLGWNEIKILQPHPLLECIDKEDEFYFVHSYYPQPTNRENVYAVSDYGIEFCSALGCRNLFAVQFHPEKSGRPGLQLLKRFAEWDGTIPSKSVKSEGK